MSSPMDRSARVRTPDSPMWRRYVAEAIGQRSASSLHRWRSSATGHLPGGDSSLMAAAWVSGLSVPRA